MLFGLAPAINTSAFSAVITEYEYNANNNLVKTTFNDTQTKYEYDKNGNMIGRKVIKNAVTIPKNLVRNPTFNETMESGDAKDWKKESWGAANSSFSIQKFEGINLQRIIGEGIVENGMVGVSQIIDVAADREFVTNATLTVEQLNHAKVQLYIDFIGADGSYVGANVTEWDQPTNGGFITLTNHGRVPASAKIAVVYAILRATNDQGSGIFNIDSIRFAYSSDNNLVSNPSFQSELGSELADDWRKTVWSTGKSHFETARFENNHVQKISASEMGANDLVAVTQMIKVEKNRDFKISGLFQVEQLKGSKVQLYLDFMDAKGQYIGANITEYEYPTHGQFIVLANSGTTPANAEKVVVHAIIRSLTNQSSGSMYVDSIHLQYSNERNLLSNSEFKIYPDQDEIGNAWNTWTWLVENSNYQLKKANQQHVQSIAGSGIQTNGVQSIFQNVKVDPLKNFEISGTIHVKHLERAKVQLYIDFMDANNQFIGANITEQSQPTTDFVTLRNNGQTPQGSVRALVYVIIRGNDNQASGNIDIKKLVFNYK
ncbi:RHS repeat protein [Paenibacillus sp. E194]|uniref:RHS repeat protein n=1 Tax=Paenibacillus sp. E194 TaxID=1458845 RepID=UPI0018CF7B69|nr:RHS repeat protein [Paenibacillus sp. E194]